MVISGHAFNGYVIFYFLAQDLEQLREEGQPKVQEVISQSEVVLPNTAPHGKDLIARDIEALQIDWSTFLQQLVQVRGFAVFSVAGIL